MSKQRRRSNMQLCCLLLRRRCWCGLAFKPRPKRQQCRTSFALKFRPFDKIQCCFDKVQRYFYIVAKNGNYVETTGNKVASSFDNVNFDIVSAVDRASRAVNSGRPRSNVCERGGRSQKSSIARPPSTASARTSLL